MTDTFIPIRNNYTSMRGEILSAVVLYKRLSDAPYAYEIGCADVHEIANKIKRVPDAYINAEHNGVTDACLAYLRPLIEGERYPKYVAGLPEQIIL